MNKEDIIKGFRNASVVEKIPCISNMIKGAKVMDVGCLGQDFDYNSPQWLHAQWKQSAATLVGVDVNLAELENFSKKSAGFRVLHPAELKDSGERFDLVIMSDVIEHVDNVVYFLQFYMQFLSPGGKLIITTPNPFSIKQFFTIFLFKHPSYHPEHTCYIDPINMLELADRTGLVINTFCWLHFYSTPPSKSYQKFLNSLSRFLYRRFRYFSPGYLAVLAPKNNA